MTRTASIDNATFSRPLAKCPIEFLYVLPDGRERMSDIRLEKVRRDSYTPSSYDEIIWLYQREVGGQELDVMLAIKWNEGENKPPHKVILYGHWNDGVVE